VNAKLFLDTNIVLDLLGERAPFYDGAAKLATLADLGNVTLVVSAQSYSTVNYFLTKFGNAEIARNKLRKFRVISDVSDLDKTVIG